MPVIRHVSYIIVVYAKRTSRGNKRAEGTSPVGGTSSLNVNKAAEQGEMERKIRNVFIHK